MKRSSRLILIIALLSLLYPLPLYAKAVSWEKFVKDLTVVSKIHLNLPLTKSALRDSKNRPISRGEAIFLTIEALGLGFESFLLQEKSVFKSTGLPSTLERAIKLSFYMEPPLFEPSKLKSIQWLKGNLTEKEAKALIQKAFYIKNREGKVSFKEQINEDLELYWERNLNPNFYMAYLKFNPKSNKLTLRVGLAGNQVQNRERLSDICARLNAMGGINGGFFKADGDPVGALMIGGLLIS
ncbi:MAG: hypothetical protein H5T91_08225, partial [Synergistetes bacterium]|nr:hypothetical protein [Synergistota bacterium]